MNFPEPGQYAPDPNLKVFFNGKIIPVSEARVSVFDHGLLYGDGVFEGIRSYSGRVFRLDEHLRRLEESARAIRLNIPMTRAELAQATRDTLAANNIRDGYVRLVVTRGVGYLGLSPVRTECPCVFIIASQVNLYPRELYEKGMAIISCSVIRNHPNAVAPRIKSLNYLNNILAKIEALDAGVHEAVMYNHLGFVAECTGDNIFIIRNGVVLTPPLNAGILEGVTRNAVIGLLRKRGMQCRECELIRHDLYTADECFLTGTAAEVIPVTSIDGRAISAGEPGTLTRQLISDFRKLVNEEQ